MNDDARPRYVYTFWSTTGEPLYVGCTANLPQRLVNHIGGRPWFPEVARIEVTVHADAAAGTAAEAALIRRLNPTHNRVYTDHDAPRKVPCAPCRTSKHSRCAGVNKNGDPCPCGVCATTAHRRRSAA